MESLELQSTFHQNEAEGTVSVAADDEQLAASLRSTHAGIGMSQPFKLVLSG